MFPVRKKNLKIHFKVSLFIVLIEFFIYREVLFTIILWFLNDIHICYLHLFIYYDDIRTRYLNPDIRALIRYPNIDNLDTCSLAPDCIQKTTDE